MNLSRILLWAAALIVSSLALANSCSAQCTGTCIEDVVFHPGAPGYPGLVVHYTGGTDGTSVSPEDCTGCRACLSTFKIDWQAPGPGFTVELTEDGESIGTLEGDVDKLDTKLLAECGEEATLLIQVFDANNQLVGWEQHRQNCACP